MQLSNDNNIEWIWACGCGCEEFEITAHGVRCCDCREHADLVDIWNDELTL